MRIPALLLAVVVLSAAHAQDSKNEPKSDLAKPVEFTGRLEATSAQLRPRVTGELTKIAAREGSRIKGGDLIAEIDPRAYQAQLDRAKAQVLLADAQLKLAEAAYARDKAAFDKGAISMQQLDQDRAEIDTARAKQLADKATLALAELNLSYTKIRAPFDGHLSRYYFTTGNLVTADLDTIITLVRTDPLLVAFDVDERSFLKFTKESKDQKSAVAIGFANEDGFPHPVTVDYIDPQIDPKTGTIRFRATLANPKGEYVPGMSVRVRITPAK